MGKNKLAKFGEMELFENVIQVPYKKLLEEDFELKGKWAVDFFKNKNQVILELGCGKGEYTVELAEKNPHQNYIGVDIKGARMHVGAKQAINKNLKNVAFLRTNIEIINHFFGEEEVARNLAYISRPANEENTEEINFHFFFEFI